MRSKIDTHSDETEKAVRDIRRATKRQRDGEARTGYSQHQADPHQIGDGIAMKPAPQQRHQSQRQSGDRGFARTEMIGGDSKNDTQNRTTSSGIATSSPFWLGVS